MISPGNLAMREKKVAVTLCEELVPGELRPKNDSHLFPDRSLGDGTRRREIGIYADYWGWISGGARFVAVLAESLAETHEVEIVHHRQDFSAEQIGPALGVDLSGIRFRYLPPRGQQKTASLNPFRRLVEESEWGAEISRPYDIFFSATDTVPVFNHAPIGFALAHFPVQSYAVFNGRDTEQWRRRGMLSRCAARLYQSTEWRRRFAGYQTFLTNSKFTQGWMRRRWGVDSHVVYPPIMQLGGGESKEKLILAVSRFSASGAKRHDCLIDAFKQIVNAGHHDWRLAMVGGMRSGVEHQDYFDRLRMSAAGYPVDFIVDASNEQLESHYRRAAVFWHAKGLGTDENVQPEAAEHFGMVTAEAMSAGCVPIVYASGGQREVVADGVNGYLWIQPQELVTRTKTILRDESLAERFAIMSRNSASRFSRIECLERFYSAIGQVLDGN